MPVPLYGWGINSTIALITLLFFPFCTSIINDIKDNTTKIISLFIVFLFCVSLKYFMFLIQPELKFVFTPTERQYVDKKTGALNDPEEYTQGIFKYCVNSKYNWCNDKYVTNFSSIDDYIYVLDFANKHSIKELYQRTVNIADIKGDLETLIEQYNDKTFQAYVIDKTVKKEIFEAITKNSIDIYIHNLAQWYINQMNYFKKNKIQDDHLKSLIQKHKNMLKNLENINKNLF